MSSVFTKVSDYVSFKGDSRDFEGAAVNYEGGTAKKKNSASYRAKCDLDKGRGGRFNKDHLQCSRLIKLAFAIANIILYFIFVLANIAQKYNPIAVTLVYYSLWG